MIYDLRFTIYETEARRRLASNHPRFAFGVMPAVDLAPPALP
jgi:hypothetical protein